ncbi:MAG: DNRLRE domain-containing protein [Archangiaceae bacterium]|nr:DNRLRE domain-containing protein [Archangiaceae bacterium]
MEGDSDVLWDALSALTFTPVADAEVQAGAPDRNFGASLELGADQSPARQAYLRFDLTGLSRPVKRAQLRCYALNGSVNGPNVYGAGNGWAESTLTYRNRPATGARLAGSVVVAYKQWLAADVTAAITGNGALTLALIADSTDSVICSSREGTAALRPQLVVELQAAPAVDAGTPPPPVVDAGTPPPPPPATGISCPAGSSEVFRDDFTGTSLDTSRWSVIEQNNGGGTFTQLTKMRAANVTVTGGRLHVASRRHCVDPYGNSAAAEHPDTCAGTNYYSGGWIKTKTAYAAGKGLMVFHAKMPAPVRGMFPALWARNEHGDQYYGELDLIETWWDVGKGTAADPNVYSSTTHMGAGAAVHTSNNQVGPFANLPSRFHVWEVEWDSTVSPAVARYYYRDAPGAARVLTRTVTSSSPGFAGKIPEQQFATALTDAWRPYVDFAVQPDSVWHVGPDSAATYDPEDLEVESVIVCR